MWYRDRFIGVLCRGQKRDVVRQFYSNLQKRTEQTCRENNTGKNYNDQITYTMLLIRQAPHTQTHTRTK